ncbi:MAG: ribose-5-phosphate isomerase [Mobiluncus porci]|uniref:Ribose-5-phosphate isomerase B n=1 Tax=Mobiluncus porci TaxID=2652278 RepID=A0A7K0K2G7_9ACTO|nr:MULTISPECIES: ribose-5-phosphate isomerase [Mobiluncus]MCI6583621.1 ribose-5-phosphate isomerase [Mobiluncus sp.]MDD7541232.1 ribose-5-phosphate isomerase [Mobiluncus porci]MDY5749322.1 ribose-5-phosphate isomerase [Mobiluncus porci]MST49260.1 ribose-5-phosphate isomerase [Mobiluncus porci]
MRVHIATDHAGYELKEELKSWLKDEGYEVVDHGAFAFDSNDDYPAFCIDCAAGVVEDPGSLGVVIGGSGNGEQMAANLVDGVRAALVWNEEVARLAREHNDANVISLGARQHSVDECKAMLKIFLETEFSGEERHARRITQLSAYEISRNQ